MFKLSDEAAGVAWEDYKAHLKNIGLLTIESSPMEQIAHMAFKMGFAQGSAKATTTIANAVHIEPERLEKARKITNRTVRTMEQVLRDNIAVEEVLQAHIEPMPLFKVIEEMRRKGHKHWNTNNASSFMKQSMKNGRRVLWLGRGIYAFDFGGK